MIERRKTYCRLCLACCPIVVDLEDGLPLKVSGDRSAPLYGGYTCVKGRALPQIHRDPDRLLASLKKGVDGKLAKIETGQAIDEITAKVREIIDQHGPRSVAFYFGNATVGQSLATIFGKAFLNAIGSPMLFSASTIDQPGIPVANALHGDWLGGRTAASDAEAILIVGGNPVISKQYLAQNPAKVLKDAVNGGKRLIVIDPRRSETARRAEVHLPAKPGTDALVLAGLIRQIFAMDAIDREFIAENVDGLEELQTAVAPFTPEYVAERAGIEAPSLLKAVEILASARSAFVGGGTGLGMSGHGNLTFYLLLCLQSIRGFWPREGARFAGPSVLNAPIATKAQARQPYSAFQPGELRVRGLKMQHLGMPTGALADEILLEGEGQVRVLFCLGNPMSSFPDTALVRRAMANLDLLIVPTMELSETARVADYVLAVRQLLETPADTHFIEGIRHRTQPGYGWDIPYAQYTPALLDPPANSDVIEEWRMFYRIASRLGLGISLPQSGGTTVELDMAEEPSTDFLLELLAEGSAVPHAKVKAQDGSAIYDEADRIVGPKDHSCTDRLDVANPDMLREIMRWSDLPVPSETESLPLRLIPRRADHVVCSSHRRLRGLYKQDHNPAFMAPDDMEAMRLGPGTIVRIKSENGSIEAVVEPDHTLRSGVVSISSGFGAASDEVDDYRVHGSNVNFLVSAHHGSDPLTGMPLMSAIPVSVTAVELADNAEPRSCEVSDV